LTGLPVSIIRHYVTVSKTGMTDWGTFYEFIKIAYYLINHGQIQKA